MAPKFELFTKGSKLPLNKGFQKYVWVTTVLCSSLELWLLKNFIIKPNFVDAKAKVKANINTRDNTIALPMLSYNQAENLGNQWWLQWISPTTHKDGIEGQSPYTAMFGVKSNILMRTLAVDNLNHNHNHNRIFD